MHKGIEIGIFPTILYFHIGLVKLFLEVHVHALCGCVGKPLQSDEVVLLCTLPILIHDSYVPCCSRIAIDRRPLVEVHGLGIVLLHIIAFVEQVAQQHHGVRNVLPNSLFEVFYCLGLINRCTLAVAEIVATFVFCHGVASCCRFLVEG